MNLFFEDMAQSKLTKTLNYSLGIENAEGMVTGRSVVLTDLKMFFMIYTSKKEFKTVKKVKRYENVRKRKISPIITVWVWKKRKE